MPQTKQREHGNPQTEEMLTELYKQTFPGVAQFVSNRGGTFEQARDVFHDALLVWYEKSKRYKEVNAQAYLFGTAKHLWYRKFSKESLTAPLDSDFEDVTEVQPSEEKLLTLLENTGKRCLDMLKHFYYDKWSMAELASAFGFRTEHSATVQKYKCLEKVREVVKEKSLCYEDFLE